MPPEVLLRECDISWVSSFMLVLCASFPAEQFPCNHVKKSAMKENISVAIYFIIELSSLFREGR